MANVTLEDITQAMSKYLVMRPDISIALRLALAVPVSFRWSDRPLWMMLVGGPATGKSELLSLLMRANCVYWIDDLSPKAFMSGFRDDKHEEKTNERKEVSISQYLLGKTLLMPDMTRLLTKGTDSESVMNQLRLAYDGQYKGGYGNDNVQTMIGMFNILAACTGAIDRMTANSVSLGERFLYFRFKGLSDDQKQQIAECAAARSKRVKDSHNSAAVLVTRFIETSRFVEPGLTADCVRTLARLAVFVAAFRPQQHHDWSGQMAAPPQEEGPGRVALQFGNLARGLAAVRRSKIVEAVDTDIVKRIAVSSMPDGRRRTIKLLVEGYYDHGHTVCKYDVMDCLRVAEKEAEGMLYSLFHIGVVERTNVARGGLQYSWVLGERSRELIESCELVEEFLDHHW